MKRLGLDYTRIDAVTPATLIPAPDHKIWHTWQRPLRDGEKALLASHKKAWQHVIDNKSPHLILEDDALLCGTLHAFLRKCQTLHNIDYISLETRGRKKIVGSKIEQSVPIIPLYQDRAGSAAYIIWPRGAEILLKKAKTKAAPSDAFITSTYTLNAFQADPARAVQLDHCARYGLIAPLKGASILAHETKVDRSDFHILKRIMFRTKRVWGQIRMGLRRLKHLTGLKRHIEPSLHMGKHL